MDDYDAPSTPSLKRRGSSREKKQQDEGADAEDDEFYRKWSGVVLLGPVLPAIFALLVILSGQLVLNTWTGTCGYDLPSFISAAVAVCYLYLIVFSWVYIGDTVVLNVPSLGIDDIVILRPFRTLQYVVVAYFLVAVCSFIVWIVGSVLLNLAIFCKATSPGLYNFTTFLIVTYWLGFTLTIIFLIKLFFGSNIAKIIKETTRASTIDEVEERLFRSKFSQYDPEKENRIPNEKVPLLLEDLGVFVPPEEMDSLIQTLDEEESGFIEYKPLLAWFRKLNAELDAKENADRLNVDDEDRDDAMDREAALMFGRR